MSDARLQKEAVLRIGEVTAVTGRRVSVEVDADKNLSELFFDGDLIRNVAVGSYVDIKKGFLSLIGRVEGENAIPDLKPSDQGNQVARSKRTLTVSLVGFLDRSNKFFGGTKELPLVGNEAYLLTKEKVHQVHDLTVEQGPSMSIATSEYEGYDIDLPIDTLMNSHIAIFGNTGSGKSNTLASLYRSFIGTMRHHNAEAFNANSRVLVFDFNGEYASDACLTDEKHSYNLSTRNDLGDKIPLTDTGLLDIEMLSIVADATEKTQKPFLRRALRLQNNVLQDSDPTSYARNILRWQIERILQMSDKVRADLLLDYMRQILPEVDADGNVVELASDLEWHNMSAEFKRGNNFLKGNQAQIALTIAYQHVDCFTFAHDIISDFVTFGYIQLIYDVLSNRAQNDHIAPAINKLKSKQADIRKIFEPGLQGNLFAQNVIVVNLHDVNLEMKKTIPLLICRKVYQEHKLSGAGKSLNIVIDEAHNILSRESSREAESWKDYRLETFEEIVKEGRKFGVFVTIASQRPSDISPTITSQAHNYFVHRLINQKDLQSIASAVSYIDKITEESIPTLPTGTCIFSGIAGQMPLKLAMKPLEQHLQPTSNTLKFSDILEQVVENSF